MIRVTRDGDDYMLLERVTLNGQWVVDNSVYRHFSGDSDEAFPITEQEAMRFMEHLTSG